jgi:predicted aspartyl protease
MDREKNLGFIYTDITLENQDDVAMARANIIKESEIRRETMRALVDTGATTLVIGKALCERLGLVEWFPGTSKVAGGGKINSFFTRPVAMYWKDRRATCNTLVVEEQDPPLLGSLALESLDLLPDPLNETVVGRHGDKQESFIY